MDTRVQKITTIVIRRSFETPAHWNEVMKVTTLVMQELNTTMGRPLNTTPADDEMWFEPGPDDNEISICYELSRAEDMKE